MKPRSVWDQLGSQPVPDRPAEFPRRVHERLNRHLTVIHVVEFVTRVLPFAFFHLSQSIAGTVWFSLTGRYPPQGTNHAERNDSRE